METLLVVQLPELLQTGFLHAPAVQVLQLTPPLPQLEVDPPVAQELPVQQPVQHDPL